MILKVGYRSIKVEPMPAEAYRSSGNLGEFFEGSGRIRIWPEQPADELADTLIHEVLHAIVSERGLDGLLGDREETTVTQVAHGLTALARDNPDFIKDWLKAVSGRKPAFLS